MLACALLALLSGPAAPADQQACTAPLPAERTVFDRVLQLNSGHRDAFLQDREGFLWFGVERGLARFDGYDVRIYAPGPGGLSSSRIERIIEDAVEPDLFWLATGNGLNRFDKRTETFTCYRHDLADPQSLSDDYVCDLVQDATDPDLLWVCTIAGGLNRFSKSAGSFLRYPYSTRQAPRADALSYPEAWRIIQDRADPEILWIGTWGGGLNRLDRRTGAFSHYRHDPDDPQSFGPPDNAVADIIQDLEDPQILWIGSLTSGLDRFHTGRGTFDHFRHDPRDPAGLPSDTVASLFEDEASGSLWLGGWNTSNGLTRFDKASGVFSSYRHNPADSGTISSDAVVTVYRDRTGVLWVMSRGGHLDKLDPHRHRFERLWHQEEGGLSGDSVECFAALDQREIWIGTDNGLTRFNRETRAFARLGHDDADPHSIGSNFVNALCRDGQGRIWVGMLVGDDNLNVIDPATSRVVDRHFVAGDGIEHILQDPEDPDTFWLAARNRGLARLRLPSGTVDFFEPDLDDPASIGMAYVLHIVHDARDPVLWLGGESGGLNRFDKRTGTFTHFLHDPTDPQSISGNYVVRIYQGEDGDLWIGTRGAGLNRFHPGSGRFERFNGENGFPAQDIMSILPGDDGTLWLGTSMGLLHFDPRSRRVLRIYDEGDGLQGNTFNIGAALRMDDGQFWFGGYNGANSFYPRQLQDNPVVPPIALTSITQGGEILPLERGPDGQRGIRLGWKDNFFEFEFAVLNFTHPQKNRYAYLLEGVDSEWFFAGARRFGRYSHLPPGRYTLRLKGSNNDGLWNEEGVAVSVAVAAPPWRTWWAFLGYFLLAGLGAFSLFRWRVRANRTRTMAEVNLTLEQSVRDRTAALEREMAGRERLESELAQSRKMEAIGQLAGGVAHDFNNLLTVINGCSEMALDELPDRDPRRENLEEILFAGKRAAALTNQLLAFSRKQVLQRGVFDLGETVRDLATMLQRLIGEHIELSFELHPDPVLVSADPTQIQQVVLNLCINARDAMPEGGRLTMATGTIQGRELGGITEGADPDGQYALLEVRDTGSGMDRRTRERAFEPFFTTKEPGKGTGLGLSVVYGIVGQHEGHVLAESEPGRGSVFRLFLPLAAGCTVGPTAVAGAGGQRRAGGGTILLAEDDETVRRATTRMLERQGFTVVTAGDGVQALEIFDRAADTFDLAILDVVMPRCGGPEVCMKMQLVRPDLPTLFITGYDREMEIEHLGLLDRDNVRVLNKPFEADALKRVIGEVLGC